MNPSNIPRVRISLDEVDEAIDQLRNWMYDQHKEVGLGCFVCPHEVVGVMTGQLQKLSEAADASRYSGTTGDFLLRVLKTATPLVFAIASDKAMGRNTS